MTKTIDLFYDIEEAHASMWNASTSWETPARVTTLIRREFRLAEAMRSIACLQTGRARAHSRSGFL